MKKFLVVEESEMGTMVTGRLDSEEEAKEFMRECLKDIAGEILPEDEEGIVCGNITIPVMCHAGSTEVRMFIAEEDNPCTSTAQYREEMAKRKAKVG